MKKNGYQLCLASDRTDAVGEGNTVFETLEEARSWVDAALESYNNETTDEEEMLKREDLIIVLYENEVPRGNFEA